MSVTGAKASDAHVVILLFILFFISPILQSFKEESISHA